MDLFPVEYAVLLARKLDIDRGEGKISITVLLYTKYMYQLINDFHLQSLGFFLSICEFDNRAKSQSTKLKSEFCYGWNDQNSNVK
jgi:hypothetical protein